MTRFRLLATAAAVASVPALASAAHIDVVLDDFSTFQRAQTAPSATYSSTSTEGNRTFETSASGTPDEADVVLTTDSDILQFNNQFGASGQGDVTYDFAGGLDLSSGNEFAFDFLSTDNPFEIGIGVSDGDSSDSVMRALTAADNGSTQTFSFGAYGGIDFADVREVSVFYRSDGTTRIDTAIDNLGYNTGVIPLPAGGLLLLGGLGAMAGFARRKS